MEQESSLSFFELNRRLDAMPEFDASAPGSNHRAVYGLALSLFAYCATFFVPRLPLAPKVQVDIVYLAIALEVVGVCINLWYSRGDFRGAHEPLKNFARQLDHDLPHHFELVAWLKGQPLPSLERHASMARFRRERFTQKLPLIAGSIPTLGLIPVAVALYFQIREFAAGRHPGLLDFVAGFVIVMLYFLSWVSALMKSRLDAMEMYLQMALDSKRAEASTDPVAVS